MSTTRRCAGGFLAVAILAAVMMAVPTAIAQEPIGEQFEADEDIRVEVENLSGSVTVTGWDRNEVKVEGILGRGAERVDFDGDKRRLRIKVILPSHARNVKETILEIRMPTKGSFESTTVSADVDVTGIKGEIHTDTVSGDITIDSDPIEVDVQSVSGDIELDVACDEVRAETVSGDIHIRRAGGTLDVGVVSGDITIDGGTFERLDAEAVSGDIRLTGELEDRGDYRFQSHSGTIELLLSEDVDAEFDISTFSGDIDTDFGEQPRRTSRFTPGLELDFVAGSGSASVRIETFSGDVEVRRR